MWLSIKMNSTRNFIVLFVCVYYSIIDVIFFFFFEPETLYLFTLKSHSTSSMEMMNSKASDSYFLSVLYFLPKHLPLFFEFFYRIWIVGSLPENSTPCSSGIFRPLFWISSNHRFHLYSRSRYGSKSC